MLNHADPRQTVVDACAVVSGSGVLSPSGHGNFSCRVDPERMLLTGAGMSSLPRVADLALVGLDGLVEEGQLQASVSEIVGMHAAVYRARAVVGAVVHTHSPAVTAFALARGSGLWAFILSMLEPEQPVLRAFFEGDNHREARIAVVERARP